MQNEASVNKLSGKKIITRFRNKICYSWARQSGCIGTRFADHPAEREISMSRAENHTTLSPMTRQGSSSHIIAL